MNAPIEMKLTRTSMLTRWPCDVCGGSTEKNYVLVEGEDMEANAHDCTVRVCEECLRAGDIDARLRAHANAEEHNAAYTRSLIGRLKVPTYDEWQRAEHAADIEANDFGVQFGRDSNGEVRATYYRDPDVTRGLGPDEKGAAIALDEDQRISWLRILYLLHRNGIDNLSNAVAVGVIPGNIYAEAQAIFHGPNAARGSQVSGGQDFDDSEIPF